MTSSTKPFTGRKMLFSILAFFGVIIAANMTMMTFALSTHTGTVVPNSYVASQDFNARIEADAAQRARGWQAEFAYAEGVATVRIKARAGDPVEGLKIVGLIGRPVSEAYDQVLLLAEHAPGQYTAPVDLGPGAWRLEAVAALPGGGEHRVIRDLFVKGAGK